mgnify:CR=1 FL=1
MRLVIFGATGMLGHKLWQFFRTRLDTWAIARAGFEQYASYNLYDPERFLGKICISDLDEISKIFIRLKPDVVINCVGIVKQSSAANDPISSLNVNSLFPHRLALLCRAVEARFIHISTDCVFAGRKGMYNEDDVPDAEDLYGRSKLLGEVQGDRVLTLRTSIIGRELQTKRGLVEWFLSNKGGRIKGYVNAIYSGFTTISLAKIISNIIEKKPELHGVYHVSSDPINKYDLLCLLRDAYRVKIKIEPSTDIKINRSLDSTRFRSEMMFMPETWWQMVKEMASDPTPYDKWKSLNG